MGITAQPNLEYSLEPAVHHMHNETPAPFRNLRCDLQVRELYRHVMRLRFRRPIERAQSRKALE